MEAVIEGMLFLAGDEGIEKEKLREVLKISEEQLNKDIEQLKETYQSEKRGIRLEIIGNNLKLVTKKEHKQYYEDYFSFDLDTTLSPSALEVLAIIAYNEPITRVEIDEIRGVNSSHQVRKLVQKNMIEPKGKSNLPGRPMLYGTTTTFLDYFGLESIQDLPKMDMEEIEELDLYDSKYTEK